MGAAERKFRLKGAGVKGPYYARIPRLVMRAAARARLSPLARAVLDELLGSVLGPDERYRLTGVPFATRSCARWGRLTKSGVDRGVQELLARGLVVRRADEGRRNAFCYLVVHPGWWPGESWSAADLEALPPDVQEGWERPLLRMARSPQVIHKDADRVPPQRDTHARAPLPFRKNRTGWNPAEQDVARFYVNQRGGRSLQLHEAADLALTELLPHWEEAELRGWEDVPSKVVTSVRDLVRGTCTGAEEWSLDRFRMAIWRAWELRDLRRRDREELARREAEAEATDRRKRGSALLVRWQLLLEDGADPHGADVEAARAVQCITAGKLEELVVAECLVVDVEARLTAPMLAGYATTRRNETVAAPVPVGTPRSAIPERTPSVAPRLVLQVGGSPLANLVNAVESCSTEREEVTPVGMAREPKPTTAPSPPPALVELGVRITALERLLRLVPASSRDGLVASCVLRTLQRGPGAPGDAQARVAVTAMGQADALLARYRGALAGYQGLPPSPSVDGETAPAAGQTEGTEREPCAKPAGEESPPGNGDPRLPRPARAPRRRPWSRAACRSGAKPRKRREAPTARAPRGTGPGAAAPRRPRHLEPPSPLRLGRQRVVQRSLRAADQPPPRARGPPRAGGDGRESHTACRPSRIRSPSPGPPR